LRPELETYQLIDNYLNGSLIGDAFVVFEQRLQLDASFAEEVELVKLSNQVVIGATIESIRQQMQADIANIDQKNTFSKVKNWSVGILLGTAVLTTGILYSHSTKEETAPQNTLQQKGNNPIKPNETVPYKNNTSIEVPLPTYILATSKTKQVVTTAITNDSAKTITEERTSSAVSTPPINRQTNLVIDKPSVPVTVEKKAFDPCLNIQIQASITAKPSCKEQSTGSVSIPINNIKGGVKPYTIQFNGSKPNAKKELYSYLSAGTYAIEISDSNGCSQQFSKVVSENSCRKTNYVFAPDKGEIWKINGLDDTPFHITILNISGKTVYTSENIEGTFEWNGFNQQGAYLDAGLYIYILESNAGEKENGQVTIVR
jgi:hypothetical protein